MRRHLHAAVIGLASGLVLWGLWFLLAGTTERWQAIVGAVCALASALAALLASRVGHVAVRPRAAWLLRSLKTPWWIVRDTAIVLRAIPGLALRSGPRGRFRSVTFDAPGEHGGEPGEADARAIAGRALAEVVGSSGPNSYVLGSDPERPVMLLHEFVAQEDPPPSVSLLEER